MNEKRQTISFFQCKILFAGKIETCCAPINIKKITVYFYDVLVSLYYITSAIY